MVSRLKHKLSFLLERWNNTILPCKPYVQMKMINNPVLNALQQRNSTPKLVLPSPTKLELDEVFKAALRAPDHASLRPWRYIVIEGEKRDDLGAMLLSAKESAMLEQGENLDDEQAQKLLAKPLRAPMIIVPVLHYQRHAKVPEVEQLLSLGAACQNILLALESLGFAAMWRTGLLAFSEQVHQGLALAENEKVMGFIYVGSRDSNAKTKAIPRHDVAEFVRYL